jgi:RNA polymerase sigma-70 factor (ECF subfamily)
LSSGRKIKLEALVYYLPMALKDLSDEQVVEWVRGKSEDYYQELMKRYQVKLLRYAEFLMGDKHAAADAVQEAFIKAFVNLRGFDSKRKFSAWIYRIVHNEVVNALKKQKKWLSLELNDWLREQLPSKVNLEQEFEAKEIKERLVACLAKLPGAYQAVLRLYYFEEKSYEEIAEVLRIPLGTVGIRLKRAKERLREICSNDGGI